MNVSEMTQENIKRGIRMAGSPEELKTMLDAIAIARGWSIERVLFQHAVIPLLIERDFAGLTLPKGGES